jgi:Amt family ammonium transporter
LVFGDTRLFVAQIISIAATIALAVVGTTVIMFVLKLIMKDLRVTSRAESEGLDISEHGESAYPSFSGMD